LCVPVCKDSTATLSPITSQPLRSTLLKGQRSLESTLGKHFRVYLSKRF
jgi:hypothetical protein